MKNILNDEQSCSKFCSLSSKDISFPGPKCKTKSNDINQFKLAEKECSDINCIVRTSVEKINDLLNRQELKTNHVERSSQSLKKNKHKNINDFFNKEQKTTTNIKQIKPNFTLNINNYINVPNDNMTNTPKNQKKLSNNLDTENNSFNNRKQKNLFGKCVKENKTKTNIFNEGFNIQVITRKQNLKSSNTNTNLSKKENDRSIIVNVKKKKSNPTFMKTQSNEVITNNRVNNVLNGNIFSYENNKCSDSKNDTKNKNNVTQKLQQRNNYSNNCYNLKKTYSNNNKNNLKKTEIGKLSTKKSKTNNFNNKNNKKNETKEKEKEKENSRKMEWGTNRKNDKKVNFELTKNNLFGSSKKNLKDSNNNLIENQKDNIEKIFCNTVPINSLNNKISITNIINTNGNVINRGNNITTNLKTNNTNNKNKNNIKNLRKSNDLQKKTNSRTVNSSSKNSNKEFHSQEHFQRENLHKILNQIYSSEFPNKINTNEISKLLLFLNEYLINNNLLNDYYDLKNRKILDSYSIFFSKKLTIDYPKEKDVFFDRVVAGTKKIQRTWRENKVKKFMKKIKQKEETELKKMVVNKYIKKSGFKVKKILGLFNSLVKEFHDLENDEEINEMLYQVQNIINRKLTDYEKHALYKEYINAIIYSK